MTLLSVKEKSQCRASLCPCCLKKTACASDTLLLLLIYQHNSMYFLTIPSNTCESFQIESKTKRMPAALRILISVTTYPECNRRFNDIVLMSMRRTGVAPMSVQLQMPAR